MQRRVSSEGAGVDVGLQLQSRRGVSRWSPGGNKPRPFLSAAYLSDERAGHFEQVLSNGQVQRRVPALQLGGVDLGSALYQQAEAALAVPPDGQVKRLQTCGHTATAQLLADESGSAQAPPLTVVVRRVHQVCVALSQVGQQEAQRGRVSGQRSQVKRAAAIFVHQGGVGPRTQQHLRYLQLPRDDRQVERRLRSGRSQDISWPPGLA